MNKFLIMKEKPKKAILRRQTLPSTLKSMIRVSKASLMMKVCLIMASHPNLKQNPTDYSREEVLNPTSLRKMLILKTL